MVLQLKVICVIFEALYFTSQIYYPVCPINILEKRLAFFNSMGNNLCSIFLFRAETDGIKEVVKPFDWTFTTDYKGTIATSEDKSSCKVYCSFYFVAQIISNIRLSMITC